MTLLAFNRRWILFAAPLALALSAQACGSSADTSAIGSTLGTGGGSDVTVGGNNAASTGATMTTTSSSSTGGGVLMCKDAKDCKDPSKPFCDATSGDCVQCEPQMDTCPTGKYCAADGTCTAGCSGAADCMAPTVCNASSHECVGCMADTDCMLGTVCEGQNCVPGCSAMHACLGTDTCCTASCFDTQTDVGNCGACGKACPMPANATSECAAGVCSIICGAAFADCNGDPSDGCEHNILQDGPCGCTPGATQPCYDGAPGTEGVGVCVGGMQTCDKTGLTWGTCMGEVVPSQQLCLGKDEDCDGNGPPAGCTPCTPGVGTCAGSVGTYCPDGLGNVVENCDPLEALTCVGGQCMGACSKASLGANSNVGCDFFPTVTANIVDPSFDYAVAISNTSATAATVTITKTGAPVTNQTVMIPANTVQVVKLAWDTTLKAGTAPAAASVKVTGGAYRVRSSQPVIVYQFNALEYVLNGTNSFTNDASILLPTTTWTEKYYAVGRHTWGFDNIDSYKGFYAVTARDNGTVVTVKAPPGGVAVLAGVAGIATTDNGMVTLNSGDVIEIFSGGGTAENDPNDISGTLITSSAPIQVIGGHQCTNIPDAITACDHLEETMFPFETLSTTYIVTAPWIVAGKSKVQYVRVLATVDNTTLTYAPAQAGAPATIAKAGQWVELASSAADFQITANNPVMVVQYMEGQDASNDMTGDPAMSLAVATDQYRSSYLFHAPPSYSTNFVNVTAPTGTTVTLDGAAIPAASFTAIGASGFSIGHAALTGATGSHNISAPVGFGISVYGYGSYTSYWYPGGTQLVDLHN